MEDLQKEDIIWIRPHADYHDILSGYLATPYNSSIGTCGNLARWIGGEFYRFIHMINSDTAFVRRLVLYGESDGRECRDSNYDRCLVKLKNIIKVP